MCADDFTNRKATRLSKSETADYDQLYIIEAGLSIGVGKFFFAPLMKPNECKWTRMKRMQGMGADGNESR